MHTVPVYQTEQIRQIEKYLFSLDPKHGLMESAGKTVADVAIQVAPNHARSALVIAGPGNNGGDAYVTARYLKNANFNVSVLAPLNANLNSPIATSSQKKWESSGGTIQSTINNEDSFDLVIDGLFGIGLTRNLSGKLEELIAHINGLQATIISIDIPSGLNPDTGSVMGCCIKAQHTVTFLGYKVGLHTGLGPDYSGTIHFSDLNMGLVPTLDNHGFLIGNEVLNNVLTTRKKSSHKGTHGQLVIIGGSKGLVGASILSGRAAIKLGAGRVLVGFVDASAPTMDWMQPELMMRNASDLIQLDNTSCIAIGPGLGTEKVAYDILSQVLILPIPIVLDADALNLIAQRPGLAALINKRNNSTVLTPHPGEASRLLHCSIKEIQADRVQATLTLANKFNAEVVLKGVGSVCAFPDGNWFINTTGNPGMASAGMGDVLTGIIGAFVAQGAYSHTALLAAVHLHGLAADKLLNDGCGPIGMTASETIDAARMILNKQKQSNATHYLYTGQRHKI
ncbi:MAG: NAD(P)H-hydrate dehydratase [Proteobacteria bacterium]|nr:NAD(P)H-hydrate dehydratase [Pseudomonadota bacterium]MDA1331936.1 NAD(P)H-hydrate dehydratase [Pseudomonadota bacterium]